MKLLVHENLEYQLLDVSSSDLEEEHEIEIISCPRMKHNKNRVCLWVEVLEEKGWKGRVWSLTL